MTARVRVKSLGRLLLQVSADLLVFIGICGVLVWAWAWTDAAVYQHIQEVAFDRALLEPLAPTVVNPAVVNPATTRPRSADPTPNARKIDPNILGKLEVPRIGMFVMVRNGIDSTTLRRAAGRVPSSALPGQAGNLVILAHRDSFFRPLRRIAQNDLVILRTTQQRFKYRVVSTDVVAPEAERWSDVTRAPMLTLITCFPFDYVGPAPQRFVVTARLVDDGEATRLPRSR